MMLQLGGDDWMTFSEEENAVLDDWGERVIPGRYLFWVELVDEGHARLLTHRKDTINNAPLWYWYGECWCCTPDVGFIFTAVYVDKLPASILQRLHP
jgi:hypothetical protein